MSHVRRLLRIAAVVLAAGGCAGTEALVSSKAGGGGTSAEYPVTRDQTFDACVAVLRWEGAQDLEERRDQGTVLADGNAAGAFIDEGSAPGLTRVTFVARRGFSEDALHQDFRRAVQIVRSGGRLPRSRPLNEGR